VQPHVLIVEDSAIVTDALRMLFEESGFRVNVAAGVKDATQIMESDIPDLMLLDITLHDGDGLEMLQRMRADGTSPARTVALTGHDDPVTRQRALDAGCAEVLVKPVPIKRLLEIAKS
jgi:DNA-binding response OmpR family regulator